MEPPHHPRNVIRREGAYWTIAFDGSLVRVRDAKGARYLARLLERPGDRVRAIDLLGGGDRPDRNLLLLRPRPAGRVADLTASRPENRPAARPEENRG